MTVANRPSSEARTHGWTRCWVVAWTLWVMTVSTVHLATTLQPASGGGLATYAPYAEAKRIFDALRPELLPASLRDLTPADREAAWPAWVSRHDSTIRARLERGDEDSVVNYLLFGTTFTSRARVTERELAQLALQQGGPPAAIAGRTGDLLSAIASPGTDERLQFVRALVGRQGFDLATDQGQEGARRYLTDSLTRVSSEIGALSARRLSDPTLDLSDRLTRFRDRGLSSDTSIFVNFAIEQALDVIKRDGLFGSTPVRRVAIVGPGLDFTDKHEGLDFYPQQTVQPFAVVDSLIRLGLAARERLQVTTFDLSPRVNHHLDAARQRARSDQRYVVQLPRALDQPWKPALVTYWEHVGDRIGTGVQAMAAPAGAGRLRVRAVGVHPDVVLSVVPRDLNIVVQRLDRLPADEQFDLIVATNVFAYYDVFEQSLALANVAAMLRPGGLFVTNNGVFELPATPMARVGDTDVAYMSLPDIGDTIDRMFWYRRDGPAPTAP